MYTHVGCVGWSQVMSSPLHRYLKHSHTQNSINVDCMVVYYLNTYTFAGVAIAVIFHPFGDTLKPFSVGKVHMGDCHVLRGLFQLIPSGMSTPMTSCSNSMSGYDMLSQPLYLHSSRCYNLRKINQYY